MTAPLTHLALSSEGTAVRAISSAAFTSLRPKPSTAQKRLTRLAGVTISTFSFTLLIRNL